MANITLATIKTVKEKTEKILTLLSVDYKTNVSADENKISISISSEDKALLIGHRGDNLFSLRYIIALVLRESLPEGTSITVDVGGYLKDKEKRIEGIVLNAIKRVSETGMEEMLPPMNPYERMLAHQKVSEKKGITSYSEGEGPERRMFITKEIKKD